MVRQAVAAVEDLSLLLARARESLEEAAANR
jgi:hypothetical protein